MLSKNENERNQTFIKMGNQNMSIRRLEWDNEWGRDGMREAEIWESTTSTKGNLRSYMESYCCRSFPK